MDQIYKLLLFRHLPWHLQKIRHFTLFLPHLQFLYAVEQLHVFVVISASKLFSLGYHLGTNLSPFILHPQSKTFCGATFFSPSFHNQPLCKQDLLICSFKPFCSQIWVWISLECFHSLMLNTLKWHLFWKINWQKKLLQNVYMVFCSQFGSLHNSLNTLVILSLSLYFSQASKNVSLLWL